MSSFQGGKMMLIYLVKKIFFCKLRAQGADITNDYFGKVNFRDYVQFILAKKTQNNRLELSYVVKKYIFTDCGLYSQKVFRTTDLSNKNSSLKDKLNSISERLQRHLSSKSGNL